MKIPTFPAVRHFPTAFVKYDEIYQPKEWSRDKVNVLLSLDPAKLDYANNPRIHRTDHDFARGMGQDVRQGPRLLFDPRAHRRGLERPGHPEDVFRSDQVGVGHDGGQHGFSSARPRASGRWAELRDLLWISAHEVRHVALIVGRSPFYGTKPTIRQFPPEPGQSGAAARRSYPAAMIESGASLFQRNCSFCHGRDAGGGESGPDLTRSKLVTEDVDGNKIGAVVRNGRPDKGMPHFDFSDQQMAGLAAFIHTQQNTRGRKTKAGAKAWMSPIFKPETSRLANSISTAREDARPAIRPPGILPGSHRVTRASKLEEQMLYPGHAKSKVTVTARFRSNFRGHSGIP